MVLLLFLCFMTQPAFAQSTPPLPWMKSGDALEWYHVAPGIEVIEDQRGNRTYLYESDTPSLQYYQGQDKYGHYGNTGTIYTPYSTQKPLTAPPKTGDANDLYDWYTGKR